MSRGLKLEEQKRTLAVRAAPGTLPEHDMRRKRPPLLSFLLSAETLRKLLRVLTLLALDYIGVFMAIFTALSLKAVVRDRFEFQMALEQTQEIVNFAFLLTALLFARSHLYSDRAQRPGLPRIVSSLFAVTVVSLLFALVNQEQFSSYYIFYSSLFLAIVYVASLRRLYEYISGVLLRAAGYRRRTLLIGSGDHLAGVAKALSGGLSTPVELVGYMAPEVTELGPSPNSELELSYSSEDEQRSLSCLGNFGDLEAVFERARAQEVVIAEPQLPQAQVVELVDRCHARGITVRFAPSTMEILVHSAEFVPGQAVPLFELKPPVFEGLDYVVKRIFDLVFATTLLIVLSPLLFAVGVAVRLDSPGPIFYRSRRPGIGGVAFACLKFRTMHVGAEHSQSQLEQLNEADGAIFKIRNDPRQTRVGRILRRFSIDELPQLFNVLKGEMSLVGPRPLPQRDFERLEEWHKKRYLVLPGITGLWQVSGRSELDFDELVRLDFLYLERWSVFLDFTVLLKTVPAVFSRRGAY